MNMPTIISWNLGHQTREREIASGLVLAVRALDPDALVLNEYVHGASRSTLLRELAGLGLTHWQVSKRIGQNNDVFVASKTQLLLGDMSPPSSGNGAAESNFLHVHLPAYSLELVGIRVPSYSGTELTAYWQQLDRLIRDSKSRRIAFIGDFNADPDSRHVGSRYLREMMKDGWEIPKAKGEWSFVRGSRIDHVVASPSSMVSSAEYVSTLGELVLASDDRQTRVSDHAALVVKFVVVGQDAV